MATLHGHGQDGPRWQAGNLVGNSISTLRTVTGRQGNVLTLDVPLTDSYDRAFLPAEGAEVAKIAISGGIEQDAVESLHILAPPRQVAFDDPPFRAIILSGLRDSWVSDLLIDDTTEGIDAAGDASRITIENVVFRHTTTITSPAKPSDFLVRGTQILILRCGSSGNDLFYVMTGARNQGPNVVLDSEFHGNGRRGAASTLGHRFSCRQHPCPPGRHRADESRRNGKRAWMDDWLGCRLEQFCEQSRHSEPAGSGQFGLSAVPATNKLRR